MSKTDELFPVVRDEIEFDKLLEQAQQALETYSGQYWTDRAEHDPGITLLEAMGYGVADLAYRQTRPLTDLLTPSPDEQLAGEGLFPAEFGPHQALTCGPISEADYRRALLDLHSTGDDSGYFFFRNIRLVREPEAERYQYWYDTEFREYSFTQPATDVEPVRMTLLGNYHLYLLPSRETTQDPTAAQAALDDFLLNNRNLGESVSKIIWLQPEALTIELVVELEDNIGSNSNIAAILADIYQVAENYVTPAVSRYSTPELQAEGMRSEEINQGPWLQHGWIPQLPPPIDGTQPATVNLSGLVNALLEVDGVKGIRKLDATPDNSSSSRWQWVASTPGVYPQLWGADPLTVLAEGVTVKLLASGDVPLIATVPEIQTELDKPALIHNLPEVLPYGRWRNPGRYYPATDVVPPCYNLRVPATTTQQTQLHQFLLAFEQLLANGCQQQALLPALLAFKRQGDVVWGQQWPFADGSVSDNVHYPYRSTLTTDLEQSSHNRGQELAITGFLLSYFNSLLAPDIFAQPANQFLASQHGFLSRHTELTYHRSNTRVDQVSSLQRRIAAQLGLGGAEVFDDSTPLDQLPFYLVEHRALMPVQPSTQYDEPQTPVNARLQTEDKYRYLKLSSTHLSGMKKGQMIDILLHYGSTSVLRIRGQMIIRVDEITNSLWLNIKASRQLEYNLDSILAAATDELAWQNSLVWLEDMNYPLSYHSEQSDLPEDKKRLVCSPFPVMVEVDDELILEYVITPGEPSDGQNPAGEQKLRIVLMDRIANTLIVQGAEPFPPEDETKHYQWYLDNDNASTDRFSFMLSVVFNQQLLLRLTSDLYATEAWVRDVILAEIPSHTGVLIHWKPWWEFQKFATTYSDWQNGRAVLGDKSYELMYSLALGQLPAPLQGLGSMYIATSEQKEMVVGSDGNNWKQEVIIQEQLLYVPDVGLITLDVTGVNVVADGADSYSVMVTVLDTEGNPLPAVTVTFAADNDATIGASGITGGNGSTTQLLTSLVAGDCTVTAIVNETSRQENVTFFPGAPADIWSSLVAEPSPITADGEESSTISWTLRDANNNAIIGQAANVSFKLNPTAGFILPPATETTASSGIYTTSLSGFSAQSVTVTISPMLDGVVTGNQTTTVTLTSALPQPMTGSAMVNDFEFDLNSGFPHTGFQGASFQLQINYNTSNNSSYEWGADRAWISVNSSGYVTFNGMPDSSTRVAIITATPKQAGFPVLAYIVTLEKWFTNEGTGTDYAWEIDNVPTIPESAELSNGMMNDPHTATRGVLGVLWSEWGALSNYSNAGFISGNAKYWSSTRANNTTMRDQISLENGHIDNHPAGDTESHYVVHRTSF